MKWSDSNFYGKYHWTVHFDTSVCDLDLVHGHRDAGKQKVLCL